MKYNINPNIHNILPQHTEQEMLSLRGSIAERGVIEPAIVWRGHNTIVDGHARIAIAEELGLDCPVIEMDFANETEVILWVIKAHLGRRNLSLFQKCELALKYRAAISAEARERMLRGKALSSNSTRGSTFQILADMAGVSHGTMRMANTIISKADQETLRRVRKGEISIHRAYHSLPEKLNQPLTPYTRAEIAFSRETDERLLPIREAVEDLKNRVSKGEVSPRTIVAELDRISDLIRNN